MEASKVFRFSWPWMPRAIFAADDGGIGNGLDQAGTKGGGGDADGDVVSGEFEVPVGLLDIAAGGVGATGAIEMVEAGAAP